MMTLRVISKTASSTLFLRKLATLPSKAKGSSTIAKCLSASRSLQVSYYSNSTTDNYFGATTPTLLSSEESTSGWSHADPDDTRLIKYDIPQRVRQKLISAEDAVALVRDGDTVCVSGFVTQGAPELVLKTLGERFAKTKSPKNLTLFFGGGPGDYGEKGLSHLAKVAEDGTCMLKRTIGGHYGQVPKVAELALSEKVEAWTLPMGSVSRMIRSQSTHSPGHITTIGLGTYVDPKLNGGAANESAKKSPLHDLLVSRITIEGQTFLSYKALPIDVALIRGTTADAQGNISVEHESLLCDQKIMAAAAKNSGGLVIAQVKRIAANHSIPSRDVAIPGPLVDCVVVVDEKDHEECHPMSYVEKHNSSLVGEIKTPRDSIQKMPLNIRKIIARRAFFGLKPNTIINLGIGLPEGVAAVAAEEDMLDFVTLSTEPGSFGGLPASGHNFGPAYNASALMEMNQMFDFYDGGGLDLCCLGAAEVSPSGDVNVSRMSKNKLTGPGGFIDIAMSTRNICFMTTLTAKGLEISAGDGKLKIEQEGKIKKFVKSVYETTFSGDEAVRRGQKVFYVTERAVFRRTNESDVIELIEIAPGMDLQKDILDQMSFTPAISPDLREMDRRIFTDRKMGASSDFFGSLEDRVTYDKENNTIYMEMFGIMLNNEEDIEWFGTAMREVLRPYVETYGKVNMISNYDGFELGKGLEDLYTEKIEAIQKDCYNSWTRYTGSAFQRAKLKSSMSIEDLNLDDLFDEFSQDGKDTLSSEELRQGFYNTFHIQLTPSQIHLFHKEGGEVDRNTFREGVMAILRWKRPL
ncbi:coenzyme A transferase [Nitzschia inconspicua]|uniref:Coenzyme A transferase n=1 Tax=Nitzschia inconspicua TaxID=303405 RepID=A0A9K3LRP4_9STRA|nr:coenzyme A transferase [Nitzschia inconspicua]